MVPHRAIYGRGAVAVGAVAETWYAPPMTDPQLLELVSKTLPGVVESSVLFRRIHVELQSGRSCEVLIWHYGDRNPQARFCAEVVVAGDDRRSGNPADTVEEALLNVSLKLPRM